MFKRIVYDIETNGLWDTVTKPHCICLGDIDSGEVLKFDVLQGNLTDAFKYLLEAEQIIGFNSVDYDLPVLIKLYPELQILETRTSIDEHLDLLLAARLMYPDVKGKDYVRFRNGFPAALIGKHSLEAWGYRIGEKKGEFKKEDTSSERWAVCTQEMIDYCAQDVKVTMALYHKLKPMEYAREAMQIEHDVRRYISWQERSGVPFDVSKARELYVSVKHDYEMKWREVSSLFPDHVQERVWTPKVNNTSRGYKKGVQITQTKTVPFNVGSRQQLIDYFKTKYNWIPVDFTENGAPEMSAAVLESMPYSEAKVIAELFDMKKLMGLLYDGQNAWIKMIKNGRIHGRVVTNGAISGRMSHCIEENQRVLTNDSVTPIKDIQVGQYVLSYDDNNKPTYNKVLEKINKGVQECIEISWKALPSMRIGTLICTKNHKLYRPNGEEVLACNLGVGDKLRYVARNITDGRYTLSGTNIRRKRQTKLIREEIFKCTEGSRTTHIHHKDHNKLNDSLENLELLSISEHLRHHMEGYRFTCTKWDILKMLAKSKGRPTYIPMDFNTYKRYCKKYDIDLNACLTRYRSSDNYYIFKTELQSVVDRSHSYLQIGRALRLHCGIKRINKLLSSHGISYNHHVISIREVGTFQTYDLSVENTHNFICEEISVSNSSPNLAQVPNPKAYRGKECRDLFCVPSDEWEFVDGDASALELRLFAHYLFKWDQGAYIDVVLSGDVHTENMKAFGLPERNMAKTLIFAMLYGCGAAKAGLTAKPEAGDEEAKAIGRKLIGNFKTAVPAYRELLDGVYNTLETRGYLIGLDGRKLIPRSKHAGLNALIQGAGAVVMKKATILFGPKLKALGGYPVLHLHDEIAAIVPKGRGEEAGIALKESIEEAGWYFNLNIPMTGAYGIGRTWGDAH